MPTLPPPRRRPGSGRCGRPLRPWLAPFAVLAGLAGGVLAGAPAGATSTTLYVASTGSDAGNCQDAASPCATVSYALTQAAPGDSIDVSGTIVDHPSIDMAVTIAQEPGGSPAVLDGNNVGPVVDLGSSADVTLDQLTVEDGSRTLSAGAGIDDDGGTLTILDSTVADNTSAGIAGLGPGSGGGLDMDGGTLSVRDSTFADDQAVGDGFTGYGGAILDDDATMTITDSTFFNDSGGGGAIYLTNDGTAVLAGDIFGSTGGPVSGSEECAGDTPTDDGYDISDDASCGFSGTGSVNDSAALDSFLASLAANGGPTETVALLPGSAGQPNPAQAVIPAGFVAPGESTPSCDQPDQRGVTRAAPCDMGAFALTTPAPTPPSPTPTPTPSPPSTSQTPADGYWLAAADGGVFSYGDVGFYGSMGGHHLDAPVVGMDSTPDHHGYWLVATDGGVFAFGDAGFYGSMGGKHLTAPIVGMTETPDGRGYWLAAADGGVFAFGDATFFGSMGGQHLAAPVVAIDRSEHGAGYYLVGADGGVFAYGDAPYEGSLVGTHLNAPIVGLTKTPDDHGYWLAAADGGVFSFGDAVFHGSTASAVPSAPIVGMKRSPGGNGYWLAAADGVVFCYGDAPFFGSSGGSHLNAPIVGIT
jgi:hypothetical protein